MLCFGGGDRSGSGYYWNWTEDKVEGVFFVWDFVELRFYVFRVYVWFFYVPGLCV